MHATGYLLFGILILGWANLLLADNSNWQGWMKNGENEAKTPQTSSKPASIHVKAAGNENWTMSLDKGMVQMISPSDTIGQLVQEFLGNFNQNGIQMGYKKNGDSYECLARVFYTIIDEAKSKYCAAEIAAPIDATGKTDNPGAKIFLRFLKTLYPGISRTVTSGDVIEFFRYWQSPYVEYTYFPSSCYHIKTNEKLNCCVTILFPNLKFSNFLSINQISDWINHMSTVNGFQMNNTMPLMGEKLQGQPIMKGQGTYVTLASLADS